MRHVSVELLQQHLCRFNWNIRSAASDRSERGGQADCCQEAERPHHTRAQRRFALATYPSADQLQDCTDGLPMSTWPGPYLPESKLHPGVVALRSTKSSFGSARRPLYSADKNCSLRSAQLPFVWTIYVEFTSNRRSGPQPHHRTIQKETEISLLPSSLFSCRLTFVYLSVYSIAQLSGAFET